MEHFLRWWHIIDRARPPEWQQTREKGICPPNAPLLHMVDEPKPKPIEYPLRKMDLHPDSGTALLHWQASVGALASSSCAAVRTVGAVIHTLLEPSIPGRPFLSQ